MKTVRPSYLHLSNILSNWVEFSNRVIESSFSIRLEFSNSTSQFDSTLFQKNFNSTRHFSGQVLDLNSSTRLDTINLYLISFYQLLDSTVDMMKTFQYIDAVNESSILQSLVVIFSNSSFESTFLLVISFHLLLTSTCH